MNETRRYFLNLAPLGLASIALSQFAAAGSQDSQGPDGQQPPRERPMSPLAAHIPPRIRNVIFLFMAGGPSQLELFDPKPELQRFHGQKPPQNLIDGRRFAFLKDDATLLASPQRFQQWGECGMSLSELLPHHRSIVDDVCWLRAVSTDVFNHGPAKLFMNCGFQSAGRPSMGAWVTYGLGSESSNLPGFVVLQSGPRGPRSGNTLWSSGFLPTTYQGVPFRSEGDPILHLSNPQGISRTAQEDFIRTLGRLNENRLREAGDPEIETRMQAYETAFAMQMAAPELRDLSQESKETIELYGAEPGAASFANNCLLARRLVERGVRFVQLYHTDWDHHGTKGFDLDEALRKVCREVDQASAALVKDLKERGLLEETLVIWGGEFGRTPMGEVRDLLGRDHHIDAFTMWMAGGGLKPGFIHGSTDELGFGPAEGRVHVHDLHATILHLLGLEHKRLTYRFQGRDYRLTDIHGEVVHPILS